jgi:hypothetical protein
MFLYQAETDSQQRKDYSKIKKNKPRPLEFQINTQLEPSCWPPLFLMEHNL